MLRAVVPAQSQEPRPSSTTSATPFQTGTRRACARHSKRRGSTSRGATAACMSMIRSITMCRSHPQPKKTLSGAKGRIAMEGFVAKQVHDYQNGKISRRRLVEILTFAATTAYAGKSAGAAEPPGLDAALVNHVSYTCPDFRRAADWYSMVFNLDQVGATARDVALTHLICRTPPLDRPAGGNGPPRRKAKAVIDHIAFTVADFDRERAKVQLAALGVKNVRDGGPFSVYVNDPFGYEVQIAGLGVTAICGAEARATCSDNR